MFFLFSGCACCQTCLVNLTWPTTEHTPSLHLLAYSFTAGEDDSIVIAARWHFKKYLGHSSLFGLNPRMQSELDPHVDLFDTTCRSTNRYAQIQVYFCVISLINTKVVYLKRGKWHLTVTPVEFVFVFQKREGRYSVRTEVPLVSTYLHI